MFLYSVFLILSIHMSFCAMTMWVWWDCLVWYAVYCGVLFEVHSWWMHLVGGNVMGLHPMHLSLTLCVHLLQWASYLHMYICVSRASCSERFTLTTLSLLSYVDQAVRVHASLQGWVPSYPIRFFMFFVFVVLACNIKCLLKLRLQYRVEPYCERLVSKLI